MTRRGVRLGLLGLALFAAKASGIGGEQRAVYHADGAQTGSSTSTTTTATRSRSLRIADGGVELPVCGSSTRVARALRSVPGRSPTSDPSLLRAPDRDAFARALAPGKPNYAELRRSAVLLAR